MADIYDGPFAGVSDVTVAVTPAAQAAIAANIDLVKSLIPDITSATSASKPDFDHIPPETASKLRTEIDALKTAIEAAPTA